MWLYRTEIISKQTEMCLKQQQTVEVIIRVRIGHTQLTNMIDPLLIIKTTKIMLLTVMVDLGTVVANLKLIMCSLMPYLN